MMLSLMLLIGLSDFVEIWNTSLQLTQKISDLSKLDKELALKASNWAEGFQKIEALNKELKTLHLLCAQAILIQNHVQIAYLQVQARRIQLEQDSLLLKIHSESLSQGASWQQEISRTAIAPCQLPGTLAWPSVECWILWEKRQAGVRICHDSNFYFEYHNPSVRPYVAL